MIFVVLLVYFFCEWSNNHTGQYSSHIQQGVNEIVREASKLGTNSKNNTNPFLSLVQDTEALGMVKALKMIAPDNDINQLTNGVPINEMEKELKNQQSESAKKLLQECSHSIPQNRLSDLAGYYP